MRRFMARYKPVFRINRKKKGEESAFVGVVLPGMEWRDSGFVFYAKIWPADRALTGENNRDTYEARYVLVLSSGR